MISKVFQVKILKASFLLPAIFFIFSAGETKAELLDRVIAIVNEDIITLSELEEAGKEFLQRIKSSAPEEEVDQATKTAKEKILNQLINQRLISQEAKKAGVQMTNDEFEKAYARNVEAMNATREELLQELKKTGISERTYKRNLRNQLLRDKLVLFEVRSRVIVTDEMINEYYDEEFASENKGGGYYLLQIGLSWGQTDQIRASDDLLAADKTRALKKAEQIHKQAVDGENFSELARKHSDLPSASDGGDLGIFQEDEMAGYMRDAVVSLKAGEISPVIETPGAYQFFKLLSFKEGETTHSVPLFEVKEDIRKKLFEKKFKEEYNSWVNKIKEGAYIKKMLY